MPAPMGHDQLAGIMQCARAGVLRTEDLDALLIEVCRARAVEWSLLGTVNGQRDHIADLTSRLSRAEALAADHAGMIAEEQARLADAVNAHATPPGPADLPREHPSGPQPRVDVPAPRLAGRHEGTGRRA